MRSYRVVEYHGSMRGRVLWCDRVSIHGLGLRVWQNVTTLPVLDKIAVNISLGGSAG